MKLFWLLGPIILSFLLGLKLSLFPNVNSKATKVLGLFFFLFLTVLTAMFLVSEISSTGNFAPIVNLFSLLFYTALITLPPTVYLYTLFLTKYDNTPTEVLPHYYLSFCLLFINLIAYTYFLISSENSAEGHTFSIVENVMTYANFIALIFIFPILNIYYCYKAFLNYSRHKKVIGSFFSYESGISLKWIRTFLIGYILFIVFIYIVQLSSVSNLSLLTGLSIAVYLGFIGYRGDRQCPILIETDLKEEDKENDDNSNLKLATKSALSSNSGKEKYSNLKEDLLLYMEKEKPYLDGKLTIQQLSRLLKTNDKYLSDLLNNGFNQNFVTFINSYRVKEAKELLSNPENNNYTIESISYMAGFHSKSTFNTAFKSITEMTPSKFKKSNLHDLT